jgi:hypothetical protein
MHARIRDRRFTGWHLSLRARQARPAHQETSAAQLARATQRARRKAQEALASYRLKACLSLCAWVGKHPKWHDEAASGYLERWQQSWSDSVEGRGANAVLALHLARYKTAARNELWLAARADGIDGAEEVRRRASELMLRDGGRRWDDVPLDRLLDRLAAKIAEDVRRSAAGQHI